VADTVTYANNGGLPIFSELRVLDLTDERGAISGRMFAEFGADVIKVEPPGGCSSRRVGPFLDGVPGPERSLYHASYGAGKRSVTLNLDCLDGQLLFRDLVRQADFVIESRGEKYFDERGIGYDQMAEDNPRVIYCSITPFGDRGPGAAWTAVDINTWAAGGMMYITGLPGMPPLQITMPQAGLHAGAEAATSSMLAYLARVGDGHGQKVVVDTQACVVWTLLNEQALPLLHGGEFLSRTGVMAGSATVARKTVFECADGHVAFSLTGGTHTESSRLMVEWMAEENMAPDFLMDIDWSTWTLAVFAAGPDAEFIRTVHAADAALERFLATKTKAELYDRATKRRMLLAPVATVKDIAEDKQLAARQYFRTVHHESVNRDLELPGSFVKFSALPAGSVSAAPTLGEHNVAVYGDLLGISLERLRYMYSAGII
jgi:crotonobetainyl-CoA:carnitine CoA-transferase CaiB-like acyl-CoA transferase